MQPSSDPEYQKVAQLWAGIKPIMFSLVNKMEQKILTGLLVSPGFTRFQMGEKLQIMEPFIRNGYSSQVQSELPEESAEIRKILLSFLEEWKKDYQQNPNGSSQPQTETRPQEKNPNPSDIPIDFPVIQSQLDLAGFGPVGGIGWWGKFF